MKTILRGENQLNWDGKRGNWPPPPFSVNGTFEVDDGGGGGCCCDGGGGCGAAMVTVADDALNGFIPVLLYSRSMHVLKPSTMLEVIVLNDDTFDDDDGPIPR